MITFSYGCTVVWWLAASPHSMRVPGLSPGWGLSVWSGYVLTVYVWVLSGYSGILPLPKNIYVRLIGDSKLTLGVNVSADGFWPRLSLHGHVMDWRPVQGLPCFSPNDSWDRLQRPWVGLSWYRKCTDGWLDLVTIIYNNNTLCSFLNAYLLPNSK